MRFVYYLIIFVLALCLNGEALAKHPIHAKTHKKITHLRHTHTKRFVRAVPPVVTASIVGAQALSNELSSVIYDTSRNADIAVYVKSMRYGDSLYARNINLPLTPASTMKILTAEAALLYLGADYRFSTQLLTDAKGVKNRVLQGNLYVVLSGDPTLTYYDLEDLLASLKSQQIDSIAGNVYIDNTAYDQRFYGPGWVWKDKNYCYAAPISAAIINRNCLPLTVSPSKVSGRFAQVITSPKFYYPNIHNSVVTKPSRTRACSLRMTTNSDSVISLDGCMSKGNYAWGVSYVVTDVPEYNRSLFKNLLGRMGVNVYGSVTFGSAPESLTLVGIHNSKPLRELIHEMLKKSDNVIAGAVFKKLGQLYTRQPGSWENGSLAVSQILSRRAGVNISNMRILDGSGLSPDNLATPAQMMQVLDFAFHHDPTSDDFISSLPIAGVDGTLKHRMGNIARKVNAKTGTISGVVSLAGYVMTRDKESLAFVIMVNSGKGLSWRYKTMEDKIVTALTRYTRY